MSTAQVAHHSVAPGPAGSPQAGAAQAPDPSLGPPTVTDPALVKRAVKAAALGNAMEWFDFGVYSYIAVTLGKVFFPTGNATAQLVLENAGALAKAREMLLIPQNDGTS